MDDDKTTSWCSDSVQHNHTTFCEGLTEVRCCEIHEAELRPLMLLSPENC